MRRLGNESQTIEEFLDGNGGSLPHVGGPLPHDHPHNRLYRNVTPIWHDGESPQDLDDRMGDGYSCGFSAGYESALIAAVLKPEWTVGWYRMLREHYIAHGHAPDDLLGWEERAEATARALPIGITSPLRDLGELRL